MTEVVNKLKLVYSVNIGESAPHSSIGTWGEINRVKNQCKLQLFHSLSS
jgi:hypothetical protein